MYDVINPKIILVSTGSEVGLAIEIAQELNYVRVISMYSLELFEKQDNKNNILPKNIIKISLEAGLTIGWYKYVDYTYGIDEFGKCGKIDDIKKYYKFTKDDIIEFIDDKINNSRKKQKM